MLSWILLGLLLYESLVDIRRKEVTVVPIALVGACGVLCNYLLYARSPGWILLGTLTGFGLLLIALVTGQQIGYGDGLLFLTVGLCLGLEKSLLLLWCSLLLTGGIGVLAVGLHRQARTARLPLCPGITACLLASILFEGLGGL